MSILECRLPTSFPRSNNSVCWTNSWRSRNQRASQLCTQTSWRSSVMLCLPQLTCKSFVSVLVFFRGMVLIFISHACSHYFLLASVTIASSSPAPSYTTCCSNKFPQKKCTCPKRSCPLSTITTVLLWPLVTTAPLAVTFLSERMEPTVVSASTSTRFWISKGSSQRLTAWKFPEGISRCWARPMPLILLNTLASWRRTLKVTMSLATRTPLIL